MKSSISKKTLLACKKVLEEHISFIQKKLATPVWGATVVNGMGAGDYRKQLEKDVLLYRTAFLEIEKNLKK